MWPVCACMSIQRRRSACIRTYRCAPPSGGGGGVQDCAARSGLELRVAPMFLVPLPSCAERRVKRGGELLCSLAVSGDARVPTGTVDREDHESCNVGDISRHRTEMAMPSGAAWPFSTERVFCTMRTLMSHGSVSSLSSADASMPPWQPTASGGLRDLTLAPLVGASSFGLKFQGGGEPPASDTLSDPRAAPGRLGCRLSRGMVGRPA